jgi:hypothetical protein
VVSRRRVALGVVLLVVVAGLAVLGHRVWVERHRSDLRRALDVVPADAQRLGFTDWREVRDALGADLGDDPDGDAIGRWIDKAYDADLSAVSSIDEAAVALQEKFGFGPATADWEAFSQSADGAAMVLRMPDDVDLGEVKDHLAELGYTKPSSADGVWSGGIDLVAAIDPTISPELQYVAVLEDQHLVVSSDERDYAVKAAAIARGKGRSLGDNASARDVVAPLAEPAAAMVWVDDFACTDLSMSGASDDDRQEGEALVQRAGKISPLSGLAMALDGDRRLVVSQLFEDEGAAKENLRARARLAVGEAPGRGGSFSDDLRLTGSRTDGPTVQLTFRPRERSGFVLSAIDSGPVLFVTC